MHQTQNQSLKKIMSWLQMAQQLMLTSVLLDGGSLATNIKDEVMVDWNAVNGPPVADQQSATYLSTMLIGMSS
jgi:methylglyoxal synthase